MRIAVVLGNPNEVQVLTNASLGEVHYHWTRGTPWPFATTDLVEALLSRLQRELAGKITWLSIQAHAGDPSSITVSAGFPAVQDIIVAIVAEVCGGTLDGVLTLYADNSIEKAAMNHWLMAR